MHDALLTTEGLTKDPMTSSTWRGNGLKNIILGNCHVDPIMVAHVNLAETRLTKYLLILNLHVVK